MCGSRNDGSLSAFWRLTQRLPRGISTRKSVVNTQIKTPSLFAEEADDHITRGHPVYIPVSDISIQTLWMPPRYAWKEVKSLSFTHSGDKDKVSEEMNSRILKSIQTWISHDELEHKYRG